tara:strand:+ start:54 stop:299 length:246 start_codon:yes stop_codon:yes gene_type:complete
MTNRLQAYKDYVLDENENLDDYYEGIEVAFYESAYTADDWVCAMQQAFEAGWAARKKADYALIVELGEAKAALSWKGEICT